MKIIFVYSKISTSDEEINQSIMSKTQLWDKFSNSILRPYDALMKQELGSYPDSALQNAPSSPNKNIIVDTSGMLSNVVVQYTTKLFTPIQTEENSKSNKKLID